MLAPPWFLADPCSTMALHWHLYHHGSNRSMSVALLLKCQLNPRCNFAVKKVMNTQNTVLVCSYKSLFTITHLCSHQEERNRVWKMSQTFWLDREKYNVMRKERADTDLDIIFLVFCCTSRTCLLASSISMALQLVWDPFTELTQNGCHNFQPSLHCPG